MKKKLALALTAVVFAAAASAESTSPSDVAYGEYGDVVASLTGQSGNAERGREIMVTRGLGNCIACHQVTELQDYPFHGEVGPSLDGVATRWGEAELRGIIINAKNTFPDSIMPSFYFAGPFIRPGDGFTGKAAKGELPPLLNAQDIEDVVAYLMTLETYYD